MVESRVPIGASRVETHVFVPFLLAVISMILVAANILLWQWNPLAGAVGAVGLLVRVWRVLLGDRLLWKFETITGRDLDGDGTEGRPEHPFVITNKNKAQAEARRSAEQTWRESRAAELIRFAAACAMQGTSEERKASSPPPNALPTSNAVMRYSNRSSCLEEPGVPNSAWVLTLPPEQTAQFIQNYVK